MMAVGFHVVVIDGQKHHDKAGLIMTENPLAYGGYDIYIHDQTMIHYRTDSQSNAHGTHGL